MLREREDDALELEVAPRRLGLVLGGALVVFGVLGGIAAGRAHFTAGTGWGPVVFSVMLAALGAVTYTQAKGIRAVLDRGRKVLTVQLLTLWGASKGVSVPLGEIKELTMLGSAATVSLYARWTEVDDVIVGRFVAGPEAREELRRWRAALVKAAPSAAFTADKQLESGWLR